MSDHIKVQISACDDVEARAAKARFLRGAIITDFAQVEFQLADLYARCWFRPEYSNMLAGKIPFTLDDYVKAIRSICGAAGPLKIYGDELMKMFEKLKIMKPMRDMLSHGLMLLEDETDSVVFQKYKYSKKGPSADHIRLPMERLEHDALGIQTYAQSMVDLLSRIINEIPLAKPILLWMV